MASKKNPVKKQSNIPQAKPKPGGRTVPSPKTNMQQGGQKWYVIPAVLFLLCFILYGNSINHGYVLDDDIYTQKNVYVQQGFSAIKDIFNKGSLYGFNRVNESNYRPLVLLNFMAEVQWFGLNPHVSHFFNVFFFAICCILVYYLMRKIFKDYNPIIPLTVAILFLFHPIHTEVVANIKSRDEILGLLFGLLSFYYILNYVESGKREDYIISIIAFLCSALSKENALTYILVIPLILYFFTECDLKKMAYLCLPYLAMAGLYMLIRNSVLSSVTFKDKLDVINNSLMAAKSGADMLATELMMMGKYLYMLVIPYPLSWDYSYNQIPNVSFANIKVILSVLAYLGLGGYAVWSFKNKSIHSFSILFYLITIFLSSNLVVKIGSSFAERFLFVPSLGFCMSIPLLATSAFNINPKNAIWYNKVSYYGLLGAVCLIYAAILIPRNADWKDEFTIFKSGVVSAPNSARTHDALAREYRSEAEATNDPVQKKQLYELSLDEFRKAIAIYDKDADIYYNMGVSFYEDGMQDSALNVYKKAITVNPSYTLAYNNLGVISFNKRQYQDAAEYFIKSYKADTNNVQALTNIGAAYQNQGNAERALYYYNIGLRKDPSNSMIRGNLANMYNASGTNYFNMKEYDKAMEQFSLALKYDPNSVNAYGNIGVIYQSKGDYNKAIKYYQKALTIDPRNEMFSKDLSALTSAIKK